MSPASYAAVPATVRRLRESLDESPRREHFYVTLLGLSTWDAAGLHERVREGLSYAALERLRRVLDIPLSRFAELIWIAPRTVARRKEAGRLRPEESDRLLRMARITGLALQLFEGDLEEARRWLLSSQPALGGESPVGLARTGIGAREVEHLIGRLERGIPL
ncbi:MAG: antitoxin Xre/MbcA/ParS toxin-binding domain-containing protein [Gemmatimonadota bacterium]|nr:antitoxin Xre/MbcA/ParS toxin-binding domain-containing protein [Gemmatimonadota bacterium]